MLDESSINRLLRKLGDIGAVNRLTVTDSGGPRFHEVPALKC